MVEIGQSRNEINNVKIIINLLAELESYLKDILRENSLRRLLHNDRINGKFRGEGELTSTVPRNVMWSYLIQNSVRTMKRHELFTLWVVLKVLK